MAIVAGGQALVDAVDVAGELLIQTRGAAGDLGFDGLADDVGGGAGDGVGATVVVRLDLLDPRIQVAGDAQDLAAHGLKADGALLFGRLQLIADGLDGAFDAVDARAGFGGVQTLHHLGAIVVDLTRQAFGQLLETGQVARAFRLDAAFGRPHPLVQCGERAFQRLQGFGRAVLGLVQTRADLGQQFRANAGAGSLLDRLHPLAQIADAQTLAFLDVIQTPGQRAQGGLDLAEGFLGRRAGVAFEGAQAAMPFAQFLGDVVDAAGGALGLGLLAVQPAHQARDGLIHALNGDGRAAFGGFQSCGDHIDGGADPLLAVFDLIGVVQTAAAVAAFVFSGLRATRQGRVALLLVFHDHGVEPFAQRHAGPARQILGDLACFGIDSLNAPRRCSAH